MKLKNISPIYFIYFNYLCTYDLYGPVCNAFDAGSIHYEGKWEGGFGPGNQEFFRPCEMALSPDRRVPFGAQKLEISRAQPPPTSSSNDAARIESITHGPYKS